MICVLMGYVYTTKSEHMLAFCLHSACLWYLEDSILLLEEGGMINDDVRSFHRRPWSVQSSVPHAGPKLLFVLIKDVLPQKSNHESCSYVKMPPDPESKELLSPSTSRKTLQSVKSSPKTPFHLLRVIELDRQRQQGRCSPILWIATDHWALGAFCVAIRTHTKQGPAEHSGTVVCAQYQLTPARIAFCAKALPIWYLLASFLHNSLCYATVTSLTVPKVTVA